MTTATPAAATDRMHDAVRKATALGGAGLVIRYERGLFVVSDGEAPRYRARTVDAAVAKWLRAYRRAERDLW